MVYASLGNEFNGEERSRGFSRGPSVADVGKALSGGFAGAVTGDLKEHLIKVYSTLAGGCACAALGSAMYVRFHLPVFLMFIASFAAIAMLALTKNNQVEKRLGWFSLLAFAQGALIGQLVEVTLAVNPQLIAVAFTTTLALFAGFSVAAFQAERRTVLYLGGILYTMLGYMALAGFVNLFLRSQILFNLNVFGGVIIFSLYTIFDTQLMILKFEAGDRDFTGHAAELFLDFAAIFVRVLIILLKNQEDRSRNRRR